MQGWIHGRGRNNIPPTACNANRDSNRSGWRQDGLDNADWLIDR